MNKNFKKAKECVKIVRAKEPGSLLRDCVF